MAVKRAKRGMYDLHDLQREVTVLQACDHPHVLPLLGYYLEGEAPCLVFPLMGGGSLADRLWPNDADPEHWHRIGMAATPATLLWQQRLHILCQSCDALLYLHTPTADGKGCILHRDFKPENILLDGALNAYLADTGFAKMERPDAQAKSASNAVYLTKGYLDPIIGQGGEYSATTDGWRPRPCGPYALPSSLHPLSAPSPAPSLCTLSLHPLSAPSLCTLAVHRHRPPRAPGLPRPPRGDLTEAA